MSSTRERLADEVDTLRRERDKALAALRQIAYLQPVAEPQDSRDLLPQISIARAAIAEIEGEA